MIYGLLDPFRTPLNPNTSKHVRKHGNVFKQYYFINLEFGKQQNQKVGPDLEKTGTEQIWKKPKI